VPDQLRARVVAHLQSVRVEVVTYDDPAAPA
jgi:hypothetical protein